MLPGFTADVARVRRRLFRPADWVTTEHLEVSLASCDRGSECAQCFKTCFAACRTEPGVTKADCSRLCQAECGGRPPDIPGPAYPGTSGGISVYGNWCGPSFTDPTGRTPPIDALDAVCKTHDLCYRDNGDFNCKCDMDMVRDLPEAINATPSPQGKYVGFLALRYFSFSPCYCNIPPGPMSTVQFPTHKTACQR